MLGGGICGNCCTTILDHPLHGLPTYLCCASTIAFPLSNPKCVTHLPFPVCLYITYKYTVNMYFYCCPCIRPSIYMVLCCIHLINTWISEVVVVVLHLILPYHSMVFLSSFVLLLFYNFLFLVQYINSIFRLPSAITFCLTIPCTWTSTVAPGSAHPHTLSWLEST